MDEDVGTQAMQDVVARRIEKTPGVCGGRAAIAGHRIRVADVVVWHEKRGYSPDEIVDLFPGINLADVYASLAYYFDHRQEIEDDVRAFLIEKGFDPQYGARPLKRTIQRYLEDPLAEELIAGHFKSGVPVHVSVENGEHLKFTQAHKVAH